MLAKWVIAALCASLAQGLFAEGALSGRRAPGFSLPDRTMKQHDPLDYRGKVLILDMMQTGCPTCKIVSGVLEQVAAKYGEKVQVLSIVVPPDTMDMVQKYIAANNIKSPILFDCGQVTGSYLKITPQNPTVKFPHVFLIDPEGMIRTDFDHDDANHGKLTIKSLSAAIDKILQGLPAKKR
jgi:peroxiredoxin